MLSDRLAAAWSDELLSSVIRDSGSRTYVYASGRRSCVRAMALDLIFPEDRAPSDANALERMRRGKEREDAIINRLRRIGPRCDPAFEVIEGQRRFEIKDRDGELLIVGKIDGRLRVEGGGRPVFEIKSGQSFARVEKLEDLDYSPWTRHALDQLLAYQLSEGEPSGLFIIDKAGRLPVFLDVILEDHLARAEGFLRDARTAIDARFERGPLPTFTEDRTNCARCDHFRKSCNPPAAYGEGIAVLNDETLEQAAAEVIATKDAAKRHDRSWELLKKRLRGCTQGVIGGRYGVVGKPQRKTVYDVPDEIREKYKRVDPEGTFKFEIYDLEGEVKE